MDQTVEKDDEEKQSAQQVDEEEYEDNFTVALTNATTPFAPTPPLTTNLTQVPQDSVEEVPSIPAMGNQPPFRTQAMRRRRWKKT